MSDDDLDAGNEAEVQAPSYPDLEREAKQYGWAPKERWKGNPDDFVDAPEFLRRAREHLPIVKGLLAKEQEARRGERAAYDSRIADFERRLTAQVKMQARNLELQKQSLVERYEEEKRQALAIEDPAQRQHAYDGAAKREREAFGRIVSDEAELHRPAAPQAPEIAPEIVKWGQDNPWINYVPPEIKQEAVVVMSEIERDEPYMPVREKLDRVTEEIQKRHPLWFPPKQPPGGQRAAASAVEGGNSFNRSGVTPRTKGFRDLPTEAKHEFNEMVRQGYLRPARGEDEAKAKGRLEKEYAANYWQDYGE